MAEKPQNFSIFLLDNRAKSKVRELLEFVNNCNKLVLCGGRWWRLVKSGGARLLPTAHDSALLVRRDWSLVGAWV